MIATQALASKAVGVTQESQQKRASRVLLVEDCPTQAFELQAILASDHLEVETAVDAECGLVLFETKEFGPRHYGHRLAGDVWN